MRRFRVRGFPLFIKFGGPPKGGGGSPPGPPPWIHPCIVFATSNCSRNIRIIRIRPMIRIGTTPSRNCVKNETCTPMLFGVSTEYRIERVSLSVFSFGQGSCLPPCSIYPHLWCDLTSHTQSPPPLVARGNRAVVLDTPRS